MREKIVEFFDDLDLLLEWAFIPVITVGGLIVVAFTSIFQFNQFGDESVTLVHQYEDKIDDLSSTDLHFTEGTGTWRDLNGQEYTIIALGPDKAESDKEVYILNANYELEYRTYEDGTVEEFSENTGSNE